MSKEVTIEKREDFTIYWVGNIEKFRVVQLGDNKFVVQKQFIDVKVKGSLWWKKKHILNNWDLVVKSGGRVFSNRFGSNYEFIEKHKCLEDAQKWIYDYAKYPIYC